LKKELLSDEELLAVLHRQGFETFGEVSRCVLEPNGSFYIEGRVPTGDEFRQAELLKRLDELGREMKLLRERLG